jgi:flagellar M-ring protein FliF
LGSFLDNLKSLGRGRLIVLGSVGAILVLVLVLGVSQISKPVFSPLYSGLSPSEAANMVRALETAGIEVEVSVDSAVVSVPVSSVARARMALADAGLPSDSSPGWEIFDNASGLGMNSFLQKINRLRAIEGELARSIQTISGVEAARVHLVLPEREAFSRDKPEPSASVIIRSSAGATINKDNAAAIRYLVSSAVPEMDAGRVTVLSTDGTVLLGEVAGATGSDSSLMSLKASIEDRYARNVEKILSARVGAGNVRVEISAHVSNEREVVRSESYRPEEQVARSTESTSESQEGVDAGSDNVSVDNNLPAELQAGAAGAGGSRTSSSKNSEIINYEIGSTHTEVVREPGEVKRVSVAVLVNGIYDRADDGTVAYRERTPEELAQLQELVRSAIGFDESRRDSVSVQSLRFMDYSMDVGEPIDNGFMQFLTENAMTLIKGLFVILLVFIVLKFGLSPVVNRLLPTAPVKEDDEEDENADLAIGPDASKPQLGKVAANDAVKIDALENANTADFSLAEIASVEGGVHRAKLTSLSQIVDHDEDETIRVLRAWMGDEVPE